MSSAKKQRATKASAKNISKYASKFVGSIIDKAIIKTLLESRKGPISVSTQKWMAKMKFSVLKKVSNSSKILFNVPGLSVASLKAEIEQLQGKVRDKTSHVHQLALGAVRQIDLTEKPSLSSESEDASYAHRSKMDSSAQKVKQQFVQMGADLRSVSHDLQKRVHDLESNLGIVRTYAPTCMEALEKRRVTRAQRSELSQQESASAGTAAGAGRKGGDSRQPMQALAQHLSEH